MTAGPFGTVVVGLGHAARSFHLPALPDLVAGGLATGEIRVVDPALDPAGPAVPPGARASARLAGADGDRDAVVHVCTGPAEHAAVVLEALRLGYRRFVVEKPMTTTAADARALREACARFGAEIVVVANWTASALTAELRRVLRERAGTPLREVVLAQHKPRLERTLGSGTHTSAFDVEMPHLVALALALLDEPVAVERATSADLVVSDERRPGMASATILLRGRSGVPVRLRSDLTAPWRERSARIEWADGVRVAGFHPCDSSDRYSQLFTWDAAGRCTGRQVLYDDTVRRLLRAAYAWFGRRGPRPVSDVHFGVAVTEVLDTARRIAVVVDHDPEHLMETLDDDRIPL